MPGAIERGWRASEHEDAEHGNQPSTKLGGSAPHEGAV